MVSQQSFFPGELLLQTLFRNRYFIVSKVGAGGFGSVYKARDIQSGERLVAIKEVSLLGLHPQAMIEARTGQRHRRPWFTWLCRPRAVWQSTNHSACRYLQLRGRFASITDGERSLRSAVSLSPTASQKPLRPRIAHHEYGGCAGE